MQTKQERMMHIQHAVQQISPTAKHRQSHAISRQVVSCIATYGWNTVAVYQSMDDEVCVDEVRQYCHDHAITVVSPRTAAQAMIVVRPGGTLSYTTASLWTDTVDAVVVPGRAFTRNGGRIGRGGGRYDRYIAQHPEAFCIGVCFAEQIVPELPQDTRDSRMDMVISG